MSTRKTRAGPGPLPWRRAVLARAALLAASLALQACAVAPADRAPVSDLPATYHAKGDVRAAPMPSLAAWWEGFADPHLNALVQRVTQRNYDLARASARVAEARAILASAQAGTLPHGDAGATAGLARLSQETELGRIEHGVPGFSWNGERFDAGASASWDPDLFGSLKRSVDAADARLGASEADVIGVRLQVIARLVDLYIDERTLEARLGLVEREARVSRQIEDLVALTVERGVAPAQALAGLRSDTAGVKAAMPGLEADIAQCRNALATLAADHIDADAWVAGSALPPLSIPGIALAEGPAALLRRRPDIIAAERRLAAVNSDIAVAQAGYYPQVSLLGALGLASTLGHRLLTAEAAYGTVGLGACRA